MLGLLDPIEHLPQAPLLLGLLGLQLRELLGPDRARLGLAGPRLRIGEPLCGLLQSLRRSLLSIRELRLDLLELIGERARSLIGGGGPRRGLEPCPLHAFLGLALLPLGLPLPVLGLADAPLGFDAGSLLLTRRGAQSLLLGGLVQTGQGCTLGGIADGALLAGALDPGQRRCLRRRGRLLRLLGHGLGWLRLRRRPRGLGGLLWLFALAGLPLRPSGLLLRVAAFRAGPSPFLEDTLPLSPGPVALLLGALAFAGARGAPLPAPAAAQRGARLVYGRGRGRHLECGATFLLLGLRRLCRLTLLELPALALGRLHHLGGVAAFPLLPFALSALAPALALG